MSRDNAPILVVEDDPDDVFRIQTALHEARLRNPVEVVEDVGEAILRLAATGSPGRGSAPAPSPALVLLDLELRGRSGLQLLGWLREQPRWDSLPVLALAPASSPAAVDRAYALGAHSCVVKPREPGELIAAVRSLVYGWLAGS